MDINIKNNNIMKQKRIKKFFRKLFKRKIILAGVIIIILFALMAILASIISPYDPAEQDIANSLAKPSLMHWLGTDEVGRDVLSRIIYGTQVSFSIGIIAVLIAAVFGMLLGLVAGFFGKIVDSIIMRIMDALMTFPSIILALALGTVMGQGIINLMIILGISIIPTYARMMRGQVISIKELDYITAGKVLGCSKTRLMLMHLLPNCFPPLLVLITQNIGMVILAEASLSFLGLGIPPPTPSWGGMVNYGYKYLLTNPVLALSPGVCVMLLVLAFNIVGDGLRDVLDPRLRGSI